MAAESGPSRAAPRRRREPSRSAARPCPAWQTRTRTPSSASCAAGRSAQRRLVLDLARGDVRGCRRARPRRLPDLATATFAEMALAGITLVGEFHYLHHRPDGTPYADPNAMGEAVIAAAAAAGMRLTLLDTCYLHGGHDEPARGLPAPLRRRRRRALGRARRGRSTPPRRAHRARGTQRPRAAPGRADAVAALGARPRVPLHAHVSEQRRENEQCLAAYGRTPVELLADAGCLEPGFTAVHATHLTDSDAAAGVERDDLLPLPDDRARSRRRHRPAARPRHGARLALGTRLERGDRHVRGGAGDGARPASGDRSRVNQEPAALLRAATANGYAALGWAGGDDRAGRALPTCRVVDLGSVRLAGAEPDDLVPAVVFAGTAADVRDVMVDGRWIVRDGEHASVDVIGLLAACDAMTALVIDNIGQLVTGDSGVRQRSARDPRACGAGVRGRAGRRCHRRRSERRGPATSTRRARGHPRLRGQPRAPRVRGRPGGRVRGPDGGPALRGGRNPRHDRGAPAPPRDDDLLALARARQRRAQRDGITYQEIKSGYGLDVEQRSGCCRIAARAHRRRHLPRRARRPGRLADARRVRRPGHRPDARRCAPHARWIDVFCEDGAFDADQSPAVLRPGAPRGSGCGCTPTSSAKGPGVQLAVELDAASADHCTYLSDADVAALAGRRHGRHASCPATTSPPASATRTPGACIDAGATVALATDTNPGSSYTTR